MELKWADRYCNNYVLMGFLQCSINYTNEFASSLSIKMNERIDKVVINEIQNTI